MRKSEKSLRYLVLPRKERLIKWLGHTIRRKETNGIEVGHLNDGNQHEKHEETTDG